jgi:hypothetical protein
MLRVYFVTCHALNVLCCMSILSSDGLFPWMQIGSRQYIVMPGRYIYTQRLKGANVNDEVCRSFLVFAYSLENTKLGFV